MTLDNLLAIHKLVRQAPDKGGITKLLHAAARNLADAQLAALSSDNRFDAAYKAIMQGAMAALWAHGYPRRLLGIAALHPTNTVPQS